MIKTLQKKFIFTAMTAISILLIVLLGAINILNGLRTGRESAKMLAMLSENEGKPVVSMEDSEGEPIAPGMNPDGQMPGQLEDHRGDDGGQMSGPNRPKIFDPDINEDRAMAARFFFARIDENGNVVYVDTGRISSVSQEQAVDYVKQVLAEKKDEGKLDGFRFLAKENRDGRGSTVVFLDVSTQNQSILAVLVLSVGIGILCWVLMLLLVVFLSKRAIRPIAENIERQKQFVTDAGHEIKTPLAIILANMDAMELHNGENKWSKNIRKQTVRLSGLMQHLLTLAKMEEDVLQLPTERVDISTLVEEAAEQFQESARQKNLSIKKELESEVFAQVNQERMIQLVSILVDNAVRYSKENGEVEITLSKRDKNFILRVSNQYESLPAETPDKLFDRFYRGDSARTQTGGGYGIGLSMARATAESFGGTIEAEYGDGETIIFTVRI